MLDKSVIFTPRERIILTLHNRRTPHARIARELGIHRGNVQRTLDRVHAKMLELQRLMEKARDGRLLETIEMPQMPAGSRQ